MFFSLTKSPDPRFPFHETLGTWYFNHDAGWTKQHNSWTKGYYHGDIGHANFTEISLSNDNIHLDCKGIRPYPLWWDASNLILTNLLGQGHQIWANCDVCVTPHDAMISKKDIISEPCLDTLDLDQCCDMLAQRFASKAQALEHDLPDMDRKLFLSGGIDTLTVHAVLRCQKMLYEVIDYDHVEYDWFTNHNLEQIRKDHWAYRQIHHWKKPTLLITGGCGDEYMFRGPNIIALWAAWHDLDMIDLLQKSQGYHVRYFSNEKNSKIFQLAYQQRSEIRQRYGSYRDLVKQIMDINANDHQHWHLGNTLTWTPFKDLAITETVLRLDYDSMLRHILNADLNRGLIERFDPASLALLSEEKNYLARRNLNRQTGQILQQDLVIEFPV